MRIPASASTRKQTAKWAITDLEIAREALADPTLHPDSLRARWARLVIERDEREQRARLPLWLRLLVFRASLPRRRMAA